MHLHAQAERDFDARDGAFFDVAGFDDCDFGELRCIGVIVLAKTIHQSGIFLGAWLSVAAHGMSGGECRSPAHRRWNWSGPTRPEETKK